MLRSSLGFHTMTLCISLLYSEVDKLLIDFSTYRENTGLIEMYRKNEKNDPIIYYHNENYLPLEINIYFKGKNRGIKWCIRSPKCPSNSPFYNIEVTINPKILAGITDYLTAATYSDMNIAIVNFNDESKKISSLLGSFNDYEIKRIDYCINICLSDFIPEYDPEQIMNLIKRSDIPPYYKEWMEYDKTSHRMKSRPESFYLCSKSVNINYYSKYLQLLNRSQENVENGFDQIPQEIINASRSIIRFEVQCKYHKTYSLNKKAEESGNNCVNKYKDILTPLRCVEIVSSYYEKVIGKGDWYSLPEAVRIIQSKNFNSQREQRYIDALKYVNQCRSLAKAKASYQGNELIAFKQTLKELADLNINPVTIPREWNIKHIPNLLKAYFNELMEDYSNFKVV
ncbi:hypothetical protein D7V94_23010 [Parablautia intestinalis]|uniref:Uncharacterized protein n=1 Tax=Parablautia intestinalis TaxID=2320100 RepID=A0A3A9A2G6_9FIRM|nr:hypothetical protein [Parablautia intestinalis]RKI85384.1 hypothetical protein D7V94_23010 [Parablautia intestinalis]